MSPHSSAKPETPAGEPRLGVIGPNAYPETTYRRPEYLEYLEQATVAIRTVRIIVYAGMTGFLVLAFYGFFLVYQLTSDVRRAVDQSILITQQMQAMARVMANMQGSIASMDTNVGTMNGSVAAMQGDIATMNRQIEQLGNTVALMQHSARNLDASIGPAMGAFNRMMPLGWFGNPWGGAPPAAAPMVR